MIEFVLLDEEAKSKETIKRIINNVLFNKEIEYDIKDINLYNEDLKKLIRDGKPKVYILDVDLTTSVNGLDIGKYIRKYDWDSEIIYVTNHDQMFEKVFRNIYKVFDFIEKFECMEERIQRDINQIFLRKWDRKKFKYSNNRISYEIYLDDILYIYRDTVERKLAIKTTNGNIFMINRNINEIIKYLDSRFIQVHRSCIVNKDKVNVYNWSSGYFILNDNEIVHMLSKNYRSNVEG